MGNTLALEPPRTKVGENPERGQLRPHRPAVEVGAVRDEEDERVLAVELAQAGEALLVEELVVAAQHPVAELLPQLAAALGVVARHLPQVQRRPRPGPACSSLPSLVGQPGDTVARSPRRPGAG